VRLLVVAVAALVLAAPAAACLHPASQSKLESELVCLECHTTLDESSSPFANQMKAEVARRIALCQTEKQILDSMVAQFGPTVLSTPQTHGFDLLAWILPFGGVALGAAALGGGAWRWSRSRTGDQPDGDGAGLDAADEQLVDEELRRLD
jgi:cytochrome c-type biogenesis protein CcmH/NrfF